VKRILFVLTIALVIAGMMVWSVPASAKQVVECCFAPGSGQQTGSQTGGGLESTCGTKGNGQTPPGGGTCP
jgi:hypothetical protein